MLVKSLNVTSDEKSIIFMKFIHNCNNNKVVEIFNGKGYDGIHKIHETLVI